MRSTTQLISKNNASIIIPVFHPSEKKEEAYAARMNSFYDEMKKSILAYCESEEFPKGAKYFAKVLIDEQENAFEIRVILRLRQNGKTEKSSELFHLWQDGVIIRKRAK